MDKDSLITENLKYVLQQETSLENLPSLQKVYIICAYITNSGVEELRSVFRAMATRNPPVEVQILTTSQFGTTHPEALRNLSSLRGVKVKQFVRSSPTFHAKGWLFVHHDRTSVAIVGSSNMSKRALSTAIEWNVRTNAESVVKEFQRVFGEYWTETHAKFPRGSMLDYSCKNPAAGNACVMECNHANCVRLRGQNGRGSQRRSRTNQRARKTAKPLQGGRGSLRNARPKAKKNHAQVRNKAETPQLHPEIAHSSQLSLLLGAILCNDEGYTRDILQKLDQESLQRFGANYDSMNTDGIDSIVQVAREIRGRTPLDMFDLRPLSLFALAFSPEPFLIRLVVQKSFRLGPFPHKDFPSKTETIFHVLARLPPLKACAIFKVIEDSISSVDPNNYNAPDTALELAEMTAKKCECEVFWRELEFYFARLGLGPKPIYQA